MNINLTLLMQAVSFGLFIWFTARFVWPPLMRAIETRQRQIAEGLEAGEQGRRNLATAEQRIAAMLAEAKAKAGEIVATGEKFRAETMDHAKAEAAAARSFRFIARSRAASEKPSYARGSSRNRAVVSSITCSSRPRSIGFARHSFGSLASSCAAPSLKAPPVRKTKRRAVFPSRAATRS